MTVNQALKDIGTPVKLGSLYFSIAYSCDTPKIDRHFDAVTSAFEAVSAYFLETCRHEWARLNGWVKTQNEPGPPDRYLSYVPQSLVATAMTAIVRDFTTTRKCSNDVVPIFTVEQNDQGQSFLALLEYGAFPLLTHVKAIPRVKWLRETNRHLRTLETSEADAFLRTLWQLNTRFRRDMLIESLLCQIHYDFFQITARMLPQLSEEQTRECLCARQRVTAMKQLRNTYGRIGADTAKYNGAVATEFKHKTVANDKVETTLPATASRRIITIRS